MFGVAIHFFRADLYFHGIAIGRNDGSMQALVTIGFWCGDIVFEPPRDGRPEAVHNAHGGVALCNLGDDYTNSPEIIDIVDVLLRSFHLVVDRV